MNTDNTDTKHDCTASASPAKSGGDTASNTSPKGTRPVIRLKGCVARDPLRRMARPVDFTLGSGEHIAILGTNGSGKTTLIETILGKLFLKEGTAEYYFSGATKGTGDINTDSGSLPQTTGHYPDDNSVYRNVRHITFRDAYGTADAGYYYQQRWNASDREEAPLASEILDKIECDAELRDELFEALGISSLLGKRIIMLSSGELRRFQIARMLLSAPRVLILENPFIGLDATTRVLLNDVLGRLSGRSGLRLILVLSSPGDIPDFITHVYTVGDMACGPKQTLDEFRRSETFTARREGMRKRFASEGIPLPAPTATPLECQNVVEMHGVTIRYGERTLFDGLEWIIRNGEKWSLTGSNGSGKTTLLSLISADNPQAYAQDITLFGRRRGSGESIWEIKKHIGYVSPEMHRSYVKDIPAVDIVASGFFDSIGLYHTAGDAQRDICREWMKSFGLGHLSDKSFLRISSGEQRLLLLARAFVKDPDLLILDEPLHGLDCLNKELARAVIEEFCRRNGKSMIYVTHYEHEIPSGVTLQKTL